MLHLTHWSDSQMGAETPFLQVNSGWSAYDNICNTLPLCKVKVWAISLNYMIHHVDITKTHTPSPPYDCPLFTPPSGVGIRKRYKHILRP